DHFGWRGAYLGLAAAPVLIALPVVGFFLRDTPQELGLQPDGIPTPDGVAGMALSQAIETRTFWQLCAIIFGVAACVNGAFSHMVPLLTDRGISGRSA